MSVLKIWIHLKSTEATASELQQALRRIGRDDIVHKLNKNDLDSEGDSLRLVDSSNLNRSDFSSRGSLGPPERNLSASGGAISEQADSENCECKNNCYSNRTRYTSYRSTNF